MREDRSRRLTIHRVLGHAVLVFLAVMSALFFLEGFVRLPGFSPSKFYIFPPHLRLVLKPAIEILPGVSGPSRFLTDSHGIRGDETPLENEYRILAMGGSTTECLYLDQEESWPYLLQKELRRAGYPVWVGNVGKSGLGTRHLLLQLRYFLPELPKPDVLILLTGANDFLAWLVEDEKDQGFNRNRRWENDLRKAFMIYPADLFRDHSFQKMAFGRLKQGIQNLIFSHLNQELVQDRAGKVYKKWRLHRQQASRIRENLPDLSEALSVYRQNLNAIIDWANEKQIRILFLTQPALWKPDLPEAQQRLLWLGGVGDFQRESGHEYYSVQALAEGLDRYNRVLLGVCRSRRIECLDLASRIPKDPSIFYDDLHFAEHGATVVAQELGDFFLSEPRRLVKE